MIELKNVTKCFAQPIKAVDNINITIPEASITCLIGTSGCGKTTTLKMINRLVEPTAGKITIHGQCTTELNPIELRRSIGYVVQKGGLLPHLTVEENIALLETVKKTSKTTIQTRVNELLALMSLPAKQFAHRYPKALSGGQQQRVSIARALMSNPPILLMDEPFGALDPITRKEMHDELLRLNEKVGKTIVLVTHDLGEAFKLGDQIILMNQGKIVQQGVKKDFLHQPVNQFVKDFVDAQMEGFNE